MVEDVQVVDRRIEVGGVPRSYRLYEPPSLPTGQSAPLILMYHGAGQGAQSAEQMSWFYPVSKLHGVRVAFLQSLGDYWSTPASPPIYWPVDDMGFTRAVIDELVAEGSADPARVYATGFSNGAVFVQRLACFMPERIAAVAIVGATVSRELTADCSFPRGMPSMFFLGDADAQFFWDDGFAANAFQYGGERSASWWSEKNGCPADPVVVPIPDVPGDGTTAELWAYRDCRDGVSMDFYRFRDGGHTWPGSPLPGGGLGARSLDVDASAAMTEFFLEWALPGAGS